jgi:hypothetical protein
MPNPHNMTPSQGSSGIGESDAVGSGDDRHLPVQRDPERMVDAVARRARRPDVIEQVVAEHDRQADRQAHARAEELQTGQHDHACADRPDHLHRGHDQSVRLRKAERSERPSSRDHEPLDEDQPQAALEQERAELARRLARGHQSGAGAREQHEHRCAEVRYPAREEQQRRDVRVRHRVLYAAGDEIVTCVIEHHDHEHEAAQHVDRSEAVRANRETRCGRGRAGVSWHTWISPVAAAMIA